MKTHRWRYLIAYIVLAVVVGLAINASAHTTAKHSARSTAIVTHTNDIAACNRNNRLRMVVNDRSRSAAQERDVLVSLFDDEHLTNLHSYDHTHDAVYLRVARHDASRAADEKKLSYPLVSIVDCPKVFPYPPGINANSKPDKP